MAPSSLLGTSSDIRWHTARRHPSPINPAATAHTFPSAIASDLSALNRPITAAEIHALLDRASQPLPPPREAIDFGIEGMEHVHQRLLDRLRDIREESLSRGPERRINVRRDEASVISTPGPPALVVGTPRHAIGTPREMVRHRTHGLPPTNAGATLHQPPPQVVRYVPVSPASTVMPEPAATPQTPNQVTGRQASGSVSVMVQAASSIPSQSESESPFRFSIPPDDDVVFASRPLASTSASPSRLTPNETLHTAFTDAPDQNRWHRAHDRDRDPSLTYRGMTVAARLGTNTNLETDESSFLSSFPFIRELYEAPPPDPVSPRTRPNQGERSDGMLNFAQMLAVEQSPETRRFLERERRRLRDFAGRAAANTETRERTTSPMDEEVRRLQRDEAERLRSLAQDIVRSRPGQAEVDTPLEMRQLDTLSRTRRELVALRRDSDEVSRELPEARQGSLERMDEGSLHDALIDGGNEGSLSSREVDMVFEGAGERREGVGERRDVAAEQRQNRADTSEYGEEGLVTAHEGQQIHRLRLVPRRSPSTKIHMISMRISGQLRRGHGSGRECTSA